MPVTCDVDKAYPLGPTELRRLRLLGPSSAGVCVYAWIVPPSKQERREALKAVYHQARDCTRCPQLAATRTTVVFGSGNADADLMFVGEAPGPQRGRAGAAVRGPGRQAARQAARGDRAAARRRLHLQHAQVPAARQPRSPSRGDRELPRVPPAPGRAHRAARHLHAGELRDQAPARGSDRDHAPARARRGARHRHARGAAVSDLPPRGRALHARQRRGPADRLRPPARAAGDGAAAAARRREERPEPAELPEPRALPEIPELEPVAVAVDDRQMGLF